MKVAIYIRVSRVDLNPENQKMQLEDFARAMGWNYEVFEEKESTRKSRPIKKDIFNRACRREFDKILVWKLDRWARSLQELIYDLGILQRNKVGFQSLKDNIVLDDDPRNMLMIHMLGAFAEFEREMIRERTLAGLERARRQGKKLGRPRKDKEAKDPNPEEVVLLEAKGYSIYRIAKDLNSSKYRVEKALKQYRLNPTLKTNKN